MSFLLPDIAQNTDLVAFAVKVDGQEVQRDHRFLRIEVNREVNRIPSARLVILDGDPAAQTFDVSSSDIFIPGKEIEILAGYHNDVTPVFKGTIIKHAIKVSASQASTLIVECRDKVYKMSLGRKNRMFDDISDSDMISMILSEYGIANEVASTSDSHEKILQYNVSDWDFINIRAEMNGLFVFADDGNVAIKKIDTGLPPSLAISYGANLISFDAEIDARTQVSGINAQSWDSAGQELLQMEGAASVGNQPGNLNAEALAAAGIDLLTLRHSGQISDKELKAWSDAMLSRSRMAGNTGNLAIHGHPEIKPGQMVVLNGLGARFNGNAFVSGVRHVIDGGSWLSHLSYGLPFETFAQRFKDNLQEMPASGLTPSVYGLQVGIVTLLQNDPKGEFRVKVRLPAINASDEGIWARLALPYAGDDRGLLFRPEIGDEVVVGFMNDDPRNPVIIGSVHSSAKPAPVDGSDNNNEKVLVTRSGMKIAFDDDKKMIEISTPRGYFLKLDEDSQEIILEDNSGNTVKLNANGIAVESMNNIHIQAGGDVKIEGMNVDISASAQMTAQGSAGLEASSSGTTVIKGSLVQIN